MPRPSYKVNFDVRDSELDAQGIVNNANYMIYLEHARHKWLREILKIDFVEWVEKGLHFVMLKSEMIYKKSLQSGDSFYVLTEVGDISRTKFIIKQTLHHAATDALVLRSEIAAACVNHNATSVKERFVIPNELKTSAK